LLSWIRLYQTQTVSKLFLVERQTLKKYIENDTDELVHDDDIRNTSRTFRQIFNVPSSERLVNCK
jgi:hypothetical protein